jgi:hypothetical protein
MTIRYLVIGSWVDKTTGEPKASMTEIKDGVTKAGHYYGFAKEENSVIKEAVAKVGDIITYELTPV